LFAEPRFLHDKVSPAASPLTLQWDTLEGEGHHHSARIKADYEPSQSIDQVEANVNLTAAQNIPALLSNQQIGTPLPKFAGTSQSPAVPAAPQSSSSQSNSPSAAPTASAAKSAATRFRIVKTDQS
ncbi:hypothetical protein, partial [Burkholderia dolosa]